jgi:hypothetical protein
MMTAFNLFIFDKKIDMKTPDSARIPSYLLPISKALQKRNLEINFDIDWGFNKNEQYTIGDDGYLYREHWELTSSKRVVGSKTSKKITQAYTFMGLVLVDISKDIFLETEIEGKPCRYKLSVNKGKIKQIKLIKNKTS